MFAGTSRVEPRGTSSWCGVCTRGKSCLERLCPHQLLVAPRMLGQGPPQEPRGSARSCKAAGFLRFPPWCPGPASRSGQGTGMALESCAWAESSLPAPRPRQNPTGLHHLRRGPASALGSEDSRLARALTASFAHPTPSAVRAECRGSNHKPSQGEVSDNLVLVSRFQHLLILPIPSEGGAENTGGPAQGCLGGHIGTGPGPRSGWTAGRGGNTGPLASGNILLGIVSPVDDLL